MKQNEQMAIPRLGKDSFPSNTTLVSTSKIGTLHLKWSNGRMETYTLTLKNL